jgi:DnaJ-class molecular chaperone
MSDCPYAELGVAPSASQREIKVAYRARCACSGGRTSQRAS